MRPCLSASFLSRPATLLIILSLPTFPPQLNLRLALTLAYISYMAATALFLSGITAIISTGMVGILSPRNVRPCLSRWKWGAALKQKGAADQRHVSFHHWEVPAAVIAVLCLSNAPSKQAPHLFKGQRC